MTCGSARRGSGRAPPGRSGASGERAGRRPRRASSRPCTSSRAERRRGRTRARLLVEDRVEVGVVAHGHARADQVVVLERLDLHLRAQLLARCRRARAGISGSKIGSGCTSSRGLEPVVAVEDVERRRAPVARDRRRLDRQHGRLLRGPDERRVVRVPDVADAVGTSRAYGSQVSQREERALRDRGHASRRRAPPPRRQRAGDRRLAGARRRRERGEQRRARRRGSPRRAPSVFELVKSVAGQAAPATSSPAASSARRSATASEIASVKNSTARRTSPCIFGWCRRRPKGARRRSRGRSRRRRASHALRRARRCRARSGARRARRAAAASRSARSEAAPGRRRRGAPRGAGSHVTLDVLEPEPAPADHEGGEQPRARPSYAPAPPQRSAVTSTSRRSSPVAHDRDGHAGRLQPQQARLARRRAGRERRRVDVDDRDAALGERAVDEPVDELGSSREVTTTSSNARAAGPESSARSAASGSGRSARRRRASRAPRATRRRRSARAPLLPERVDDEHGAPVADDLRAEQRAGRPHLRVEAVARDERASASRRIATSSRGSSWSSLTISCPRRAVDFQCTLRSDSPSSYSRTLCTSKPARGAAAAGAVVGARPALGEERVELDDPR